MKKHIIFILLFFTIHFFAFSQVLKPNKESDQQLIRQKIAVVMSEVDTSDWGSAHLADTATIIYSPDYRFKVVYTVGESCGAYCNPYNVGWLFLATKNGSVVEKAMDFCDPVDEIHILQKTKTYTDYLLMMSNWSRPAGFESGDVWNFIHLRVYDDRYEIISPALKDGTDSYHGVFSSNVLCKEEKQSGMWFNKKNKSITYLTFEYRAENGNCIMISGKYNFVKGQFVQVSEITKEAKLNE